MRRLWLLLAALVFGAAPLRAQQPTFTDSLMDRMVGRWVLRGTIAGEATTHDVTVDWVLQHQYLRVHEVARERDAAGKPAYEADVYIGWDAQANQYVCAWLDVFGGISTQSIGRATRGGDAIPFVFTNRDDRGGFHTTMAYQRATDSWTWRMDNVAADGTESPFARVALTRQ
jgi:hypothetical protein